MIVENTFIAPLEDLPIEWIYTHKNNTSLTQMSYSDSDSSALVNACPNALGTQSILSLLIYTDASFINLMMFSL